ncbi:MAG: PhzF family phenazine biosynthesis protein [Methanomicrobiales archaeon]
MSFDPIISIHMGGLELLMGHEIAKADSVFISAPQPVEQNLSVSRDGNAAALWIAPDEVSENHRIACIKARLFTLIVPINSPLPCSLHPDQQHLKEFGLTHGIEIICIVTTETSSAGNRYQTWVFAPVGGYLEDPATGSGNTAPGYYLLKEGTWDGHMIAIELGKVQDRPNIIRIVSDASKVQHSVFFCSNALVLIEGKYLLYS